MASLASAIAALLVAGGAAVAVHDNDSTGRAETISDGQARAKIAKPKPAKEFILTKAQVNRAMLKVTDMPTGYSVDPDTSSDSDDSPAACAAFDRLDTLDKTADTTATAEVGFKASDFGPFVGESITVQPRTARSNFRLFAGAASQCRMFSSKNDDGTRSEVTVSALSFPKFGDETFAMRLRYSSPLGPLTVDLIIVRRGATLLTMAATGFGGSPPNVERLTRKAVARVEAVA